MNKFDDLCVYNKYYSLLKNIKCANQRAKMGFCERDTYEIDSWFLTIIPKMLDYLNKKRRGYPCSLMGEFYDRNKERIEISKKDFLMELHSDKYSDLYDECDDWCDKRWNEILNNMIYIFNECDYDKCSMKNEFEEECQKALEEFDKKYGLLGHKLMTEEEKKKAKETGLSTAHLVTEIPEYNEIWEKYSKREREIEKYQRKCKKRALKLFVRYFNELWW